MVMAKTKQAAKSYKGNKVSSDTFDGVYLLKLMLYLLLGSVWLKVSKGSHGSVPVPVGLLVGLVFTLHEHFQIDRKIEYAIMLVAMLFGFFAPYGLYVNL